jgi:hypothetical protein
MRWFYGNFNLDVALGGSHRDPKVRSNAKRVSTLAQVFNEQLLLACCLELLFEKTQITELTVASIFSFASQAGSSRRPIDLRSRCIQYVRRNLAVICTKPEVHRAWPPSFAEIIVTSLQGTLNSLLLGPATYEDFPLPFVIRFAHDRLLGDDGSVRILYDGCIGKSKMLLSGGLDKFRKEHRHAFVFDTLMVSEHCGIEDLSESCLRVLLEARDDISDCIRKRWEAAAAEPAGASALAKLEKAMVARCSQTTKTKSTMCQGCHSDFTVFIKRKHCALCKSSFCKKCLSEERGPQEIFTACNESLPVHVCIPCHNLCSLLSIGK